MRLVLLTGMHRSSTSLITQYLNSCGLETGSNLIGPASDNQDGYYENKTVVNLHNRLINKSSHNIITAKPIARFNKNQKDILRNEVNSIHNNTTNKNQPILLKDPRICLFLNAWKDTFPTAIFIFIFRDYKEVIDSLFRRNTNRVLRYKPWLAAEVWIRYNDEIFKFYKNNSNSSVIINNNQIIDSAGSVLNAINEKLTLNLTYFNMDHIYKPDLTRRNKDVSIKTKVISFFYRKRLEKMQGKLYEKALTV